MREKNKGNLLCCFWDLTMVQLPAGSQRLLTWQHQPLSSNTHSRWTWTSFDVLNKGLWNKLMEKKCSTLWKAIFIIVQYLLSVSTRRWLSVKTAQLHFKLVLHPCFDRCGFSLLFEPLYVMWLNLTEFTLCYGNISYTHMKKRENMPLFIYSFELFLF